MRTIVAVVHRKVILIVKNMIPTQEKKRNDLPGFILDASSNAQPAETDITKSNIISETRRNVSSHESINNKEKLLTSFALTDESNKPDVGKSTKFFSLRRTLQKERKAI